MEKTNNTEIKNLLDSLSESDSDVSDLVLAPRKRKVKRRPRQGVRVKQSSSCSCSRSQSRTVSLWLAAVLITFWLIALSWLAAVLYSEIGRIDVSIRSAVVDNVRRVEAAEATTTETTTTTTTTSRHGMSSSPRAPGQRSIIEALAQVRIYDKRNEAGYKFVTESSVHRRSSGLCSDTRRDKFRNATVRIAKRNHCRAVKSEFDARWSNV